MEYIEIIKEGCFIFIDNIKYNLKIGDKIIKIKNQFIFNDFILRDNERIYNENTFGYNICSIYDRYIHSIKYKVVDNQIDRDNKLKKLL